MSKKTGYKILGQQKNEELNLLSEKIKSQIFNIKEKIARLNKEFTETYFFDKNDIANMLEHDYFLEENFGHEKNKELDRSERTDNLYCAIHLLEALYFLKNIHLWDSDDDKIHDPKNISCPKCTDGLMIRNNKNIISFKCNKCGATYSSNNTQNPNDLTEKQIAFILHHKKCFLKKNEYRVSFNENYINIRKSSETSIKESEFSDCQPIYPIISITCNSMGRNAPSYESNKSVIPGSFNFMLVDEAGTITPSKMSVLHCTNKAMFFGDSQQLKPVFSYSEKFEDRLLEEFFDSEEESEAIDFISEYFSCADYDVNTIENIEKANNAMKVANNSTHFYLPYSPSRMDGDIWLKEHFRCRNSIVAIANEIAYKNEMIPQRQNLEGIKEWKHLEMVHHENAMSRRNVNEKEVEIMIQYIKSNIEHLRNIYCTVKKIDAFTLVDDDVVLKEIGIVTPFVLQESMCKDLLYENNMQDVKVGTVHKYQGSEKLFILFSSVYNTESIGKTANFFFNRGEPDMINVAVTRAKELFVCFGHKDILNVENTFSGKMIKAIEADNGK